MKITLFSIITLTLFTFSIQAGEADRAYFEQFQYVVEVDNQDPDFPLETHRYLMFGDPKLFYTGSEGEEFFVRINLYLMKDGSYRMFYKEFVYTDRAAGHFMSRGCKEIKGQWSVPDTQLVLDSGIATGDRAIWEGQQAVGLNLLQPIMAPEPLQSQMVFSYGYSNVGPDQEFCF